jgi:hypothetical protein
MEGQAVKEIAALEDKSKTIEVDGKTFARETFHPVQYIPRPMALTGKTLTGLIDYLKANREGIPIDDQLVQVEDYSKVVLHERFSGDDLKRTVFYVAKLDDSLPTFRFDTYMPVEEFIIKARALFQPSTDLDAVIAIVSRVVAQDEISGSDNGISQSLQVKKGVSGALSESIHTKGMYDLRPYRTFRELTQPESKFILRLKPVDGGLPQVALFDAEGGTWRYKAMQEIKIYLQEYFESFGIDIPVYAEKRRTNWHQEPC